jgi:hypothetical protein
MGQLRDGILALQKSSINFEPEITELEKQQDELSQRVYAAGQRIQEGLNALVMYLMEKLKKAGKTFEGEAAKPLKDHMDSNVVTLGKGIVQAKNDVKAMIAKLNAQHKASVAKLTGSLDASAASAAKLKGIAEKKKAKWLKSAKYKAKIGGYLAALGAVDEILKRQREAINGLASLNQNDAWVERCYKFDQNMNMKQVRDVASADFNTNYKDFAAQKGQIGARAKKFRDEYKGLGAQFAVMKKWMEEADAMEAESEE